MTIWVTKYVFTWGILKYTNAVDCSDISLRMVKVPAKKGGYCDQFFHNKEWHKTEKEAQMWAIEMARNRIISLKKQIERIEAMQSKNFRVEG